MKVMIEGDILNIGVWDSDTGLSVMSIQPVFRLDSDLAYGFEARRLSRLMYEKFGTRLLSVSQPFGCGVAESQIDLIRNQDGRPCIRCTIAELGYQEFGVPMLVEKVVPFNQHVAVKLGATFQYSAVAISEDVPIFMSGASTVNIGRVLVTDRDGLTHPTWWTEYRSQYAGNGIRALLESLGSCNPVLSNLGRWYAPADKEEEE